MVPRKQTHICSLYHPVSVNARQAFACQRTVSLPQPPGSHPQVNIRQLYGCDFFSYSSSLSKILSVLWCITNTSFLNTLPNIKVEYDLKSLQVEKGFPYLHLSICMRRRYFFVFPKYITTFNENSNQNKYHLFHRKISPDWAPPTFVKLTLRTTTMQTCYCCIDIIKRYFKKYDAISCITFVLVLNYWLQEIQRFYDILMGRN